MNGAQDHLQPIWHTLGTITYRELVSADLSLHNMPPREKQRRHHQKAQAGKQSDMLHGLEQSLNISEPWILTPENDIIIMAFHRVVTRIK